MQIVKNEVDEETINIKPVGRLDISSAADFKKEVTETVEKYKNLILDFSEITFISSIGLSGLLELSRLMNDKHGSMKLINVSFDVMYIFNITGFDKILNIE
ncbi:STAS domain-containing protein [bacterium]|nr:STAS domain-containing protein [bacterium]